MANQLTLAVDEDAVDDGAPAETITIEAETLEAALARITGEMGPHTRILRVDRARRGGIGGFFAKEVVEVEVVAAAHPGGVAAAFDRLLAEAEAEPIGETPTPGAPEISVRAPVTPPAPLNTVDWGAARMLEVGLPGQLVQAISDLAPADDLAHLSAVTEVMTVVCGPLPAGPAHLVGERADRLRHAVDIDESPAGYLHLVVGDDLPGSLPGVPAVVSWVTDRGAARAIALALGTGARLGYGIGSGFGAPPRRISAVDAAIAVRDLMERT